MGSRLPVVQDVCSDVGYVTREEEEVLIRMRRLRGEAEEVRSLLRGGESPTDEIAELEDRLEALRRQWQELDREREAANRRKLILLGHLEPGDSDLEG